MVLSPAASFSSEQPALYTVPVQLPGTLPGITKIYLTRFCVSGRQNYKNYNSKSGAL